MAAIKPLQYAKLVRLFELGGWVHSRTKGDHLSLIKPGCKRPVVIPRWDLVPVLIIQNNLRTAGISRARYFELLAQV
jgi:predicted RNA binding protein YcfA (HicA-like mRNA interferase family)